MDTVYLVVGLMRSGTSLMMQMCDASGLRVVRDATRDQFKNVVMSDGFRLNPESLFELQEGQIADGLVSAKTGDVIKLVQPWLKYLPEPSTSRRYEVVMVRRHLEEVRQEWEAARLGVVTIEELQGYEERMQLALSQRPDVHLVSVRFEDLVFKPAETVKWLQDRSWPLTDAAALVSDEDHYKFRLVRAGVPPHSSHPPLIEGL